MAEINLLQSKIEEGGVNSNPIAKAIAKLLMFLFILLLAAYAVLVFNDWRTSNQLEDLNKKVEAVQANAISNKDRLELITRQEQLSELETLIDNHTYWSYLLPELARVTIKTAKYTQIEAEDTGDLTLSATLPNYEEVEKFLQIFDLPEYNQQFSNVRILSMNKVLTSTTVSTELRLQLKFNPEFIKAKPESEN